MMPRLFAAALLCCTVTAHALTLSGAVIGENGKAQSGVRVWLSQDREVRTQLTDGRGAFEFPEVRPGVVDVVAWREGSSMAGFTDIVADDAAVALHLREPHEMNLRIVSHTFVPVEGARLVYASVSDIFRVSATDLSDHGFPSIRSDADGNLTIPALPPHSFVRFSVDHIDHAQTYIAYYAGGKDRQDIVLRRGIELRGRVFGPNDKPLEDARVSMSIKTVSGLRAQAEPLTDPEGFFHAKVAPGEIVLHVRHPDFAPADAVHVRLPESQDEFTVPDLRLPAPHTVSGTVVDGDGNPMPKVEVVYLRNETAYTHALTDGSGAYELKVAEGEGEVAVVPPNGLMIDGLSRLPATVEASAETVSFSPVRLVPLPVVEGVVRGRDGSAENDVIVRSTTLDHDLWAVTDADGRFEIPLGTARYQDEIGFYVEHGLRFYRGDFTIDPHDAKPVDVRLSRFDPDETPLREGTIYAQLAARDDPEPEAEDDPGAFQVSVVGNDMSDLDGKPAPEWTCSAWYNTDPITLASLKGKVVVLTFWGGFDLIGPGRQRINELNWLYKIFKDVDDVAVIGIHDSSIEADGVKEYVAGYGIEYPVGLDQEPAVSFSAYNTSIIPQTVLIDKEGKLRYYDVDGRVLELIKALRRE